ncbi:MAG: hypothetical protein CFE32_10555 [Alphaproteobacteria bacterium PA3]|nr:MAG: hypothetical protein CFE32_10555 [Alphaproteobacteria bacterium PA3]
MPEPGLREAAVQNRGTLHPAVSEPKGQVPGKREARSTPTWLIAPQVRCVEVGPARQADRQDGQTKTPARETGEAVSLAAIWRAYW